EGRRVARRSPGASHGTAPAVAADRASAVVRARHEMATSTVVATGSRAQLLAFTWGATGATRAFPPRMLHPSHLLLAAFSLAVAAQAADAQPHPRPFRIRSATAP